ncbi:DUF262 domain-containing protein [Pseudomonas fragi]|uniref:DUF262 domain-containing protein n=1 Tax=Pseudomonas fragi TaxID=296 RepID=UPI002D7A3F50|nr:DUF262 domain-containing protein [Pseudomonas fragi]WRT62614.1 DUF262 domain-containing protein [Pseudomonas fragi]
MEYEVSLQTVSWFNRLRNDDSLQISPKFQRRAVWMEKERSLLMDTILKNLPFPEVYMQVQTNSETGAQQHIVVDGQQRVTSILMFIDNAFPLPINGDWSGEYFRDLKPETKELFWDYKIVARFLRKTNDDEIRNIFTRLNTNNVVLNDQELRNARYIGQFKQLTERLADNPYFQSIGLFTPRDVRRMLDIEYVSELLLRQVYGITNKKDLLETAYMEFEEEFPMEAECEEAFNTSIGLIKTIVDKDNLALFKSKGVFHSLFGVCHDYYKKTTLPYFKDVAQIKNDLTILVIRAKENNFDPGEPDIAQYSEVSSRSTSDKSKRSERERIFWNIISKVEGV